MQEEGGSTPRGGLELVTIVGKHEVNNAQKLAAALYGSRYVAVESGSCYALVCQCHLQEAGSGTDMYTLAHGDSLYIGMWKIEFERGRHYIVVGPAVDEQPDTALLDIMARVDVDRNGRDPIYETPGWTDPANQRPLSNDAQDPRKIGMPLDPHRAALRVVNVFDILDDWSLSDLLRKSRYIALQGDWRRLGAKLSLEPARRRQGFWLRRHPHVVGVYLGDAQQWGEYTFVGPSGDTVPETPLPQLLALLKTDLHYTQTLAEESLCEYCHTHSKGGLVPPPQQPHEAVVGSWRVYLYGMLVSLFCWRAKAVIVRTPRAPTSHHRVDRVSA